MPCIASATQNVLALLVEAGLAKSKRIARELIESNAISVNGNKVTSDNQELDFGLFDHYWLIQRGKKHFCLISDKVPSSLH